MICWSKKNCKAEERQGIFKEKQRNSLKAYASNEKAKANWSIEHYFNTLKIRF